MKSFAPFFIVIICFYSAGSFAQGSKHVVVNEKMVNAEIASNNDLAVVYYHVEERINMRSGSNITTYDVTSLSLINTNDLGENNVRIVTPKYGKVKPTAALKINIESVKAEIVTNKITTSTNVIKIDNFIPKKRKDYANIEVIDTYERVLDKGFKSAEMIKKVADSHFFDDNMNLAAKWYTELFAIDTNLEAVYYYRYATALKAIGQNKKADEMMKLFDSKNL